MDLALTDEQTMLRDAVGELLDREGGWAELVEFGALEEGLGAVELALIAWNTGAHLAAVPFVESAALAYVAPGHGRAAVCFGELAALSDGRVSGEFRGVAFAESAEVLAVPVSESAIALVRPDSFEPETTLDPSLAPALVRFDAAEIVELLDVDVERLFATAAVLAAADAVGAAAAVLELARTYASQRRQFGHTIGSFQAIRHLLADMYVDVESAWSSVLYAAAALDEREPDACRTASIAKAYAGRATLDVAHGALQVFGGIAFTAEHPAHRFLRRIVARREEFGTPRDHARRLGRALARGAEVVA